jgi:hypothetical protein
VAFGVLYHDPAATYDAGVAQQVAEARAARPNASLADLLAQGGTWSVGDAGSGKREE